MKTTAYNGSRKAYLCPAINITEIKTETFMQTTSPTSVPEGGEGGPGVAETKRRRSIFDNDVDAMEERGIW